MNKKKIMKNKVSLVIVIFLIVVLGYLTSQSFSIISDRYNFMDVAMDQQNQISIIAGEAEEYSGLYGAYALFVDDEFKEYTAFSTSVRGDDDGLLLYQDSIDANKYLTKENQKVTIYYEYTHIRNGQRDDYLSSLSTCGISRLNQFNGENMPITFAEMIRNYHLCSQADYGDITAYPPYSWNEQAQTCYSKISSDYVDNKECFILPRSWNSIESASLEEIQKFKSFDNKFEEYSHSTNNQNPNTVYKIDDESCVSVVYSTTKPSGSYTTLEDCQNALLQVKVHTEEVFVGCTDDATCKEIDSAYSCNIDNGVCFNTKTIEQTYDSSTMSYTPLIVMIIAIVVLIGLAFFLLWP